MWRGDRSISLLQVWKCRFQKDISNLTFFLYSLGEGLRLKCSSLHKPWFHPELARLRGEEETVSTALTSCQDGSRSHRLVSSHAFGPRRCFFVCDLLRLWITEQSRKSCWWRQTHSAVVEKGQFQFNGIPFRKGGLQFLKFLHVPSCHNKLLHTEHLTSE